jgi:hypothetical protein
MTPASSSRQASLLVFLAALSTLALGCRMIWVHPYASHPKFHDDQERCMKNESAPPQLRPRAQSGTVVLEDPALLEGSVSWKRCMGSLGWKRRVGMRYRPEFSDR